MKSDLGARLWQMEQVSCTIYDIALLFECEQIIDVDMKKRHPILTSVNHLAKVKIPDRQIHHSRMGLHLDIRDLSERDRSSS